VREWLPAAVASWHSASPKAENNIFSGTGQGMGFIRQQEEKWAVRFLRWQYEKQKLATPAESDLKRLAAHMVDEAHRIGRERGGNLIDILKELVQDFFKKK
jgi:hypothetical protein